MGEQESGRKEVKKKKTKNTKGRRDEGRTAAEAEEWKGMEQKLQR
jgi:hypothetical protein